MNATEWLESYARRLEIEAPTTDEIKRVLDLAAAAAHASERVAAPVACWLAASAGVDLEEALDRARKVQSDG